MWYSTVMYLYDSWLTSLTQWLWWFEVVNVSREMKTVTQMSVTCSVQCWIWSFRVIYWQYKKKKSIISHLFWHCFTFFCCCFIFLSCMNSFRLKSSHPVLSKNTINELCSYIFLEGLKSTATCTTQTMLLQWDPVSFRVVRCAGESVPRAFNGFFF